MAGRRLQLVAGLIGLCTRGAVAQELQESILAGAVSDYFDFLAARPNFVRLIEREALAGETVPYGEGHLTAGQEALAAISAELGLDAPQGERQA